MAALCGPPQSISGYDDMCSARGSRILQKLTFGIRHHLRGSFMGMKGIQLSEGPSIICTHSINIVAKRGDLVDKQKEDNKKSKIQIIKKYDSRYQGPPLIYTHP